MREIKFRAWDKKYNTMLNWATLGQTLHPGFELMQFTGMTDKNVKEIYEGDIVKIGSHYEGDHLIREYVGEVCFMDCGFVLFKDKKYKEELDNNCFNERVVVIGNIYENPELLNEKKKMECGYCKNEIKGEYHCSVHDEPPFFCSETCYGKRN